MPEWSDDCIATVLGAAQLTALPASPYSALHLDAAAQARRIGAVWTWTGIDGPLHGPGLIVGVISGSPGEGPRRDTMMLIATAHHRIGWAPLAPLTPQEGAQP